MVTRKALNGNVQGAAEVKHFLLYEFSSFYYFRNTPFLYLGFPINNCLP